MIHLNLTPATRWGLNLVALLAAVVALRLGESIFIPTVIAVLLAAMLWPGVVWLHQRLLIPWPLACLVSVGGLVLLILFVTLGFSVTITKMLQDIPNPNLVGESKQQELYAKFRSQLERISPVLLNEEYFPMEARESRIYLYIKESLRGENIAHAIWRIGMYANAWMWQWVLIMFLLLFVLLEGRMLSRKVVEIFGPAPEVQESVVGALADMAEQVRVYLVWRTIINCLLAISLGAIYYWMGLQQWVAWALLTAVLCYIPYIGPIIAGIPPIIDALITAPSPWYAMAILAIYLVLITAEGYLIVPIVMGRSMDLNATTVMLACLFWDLVWGTSGLFLAMPLMAAIKAVCYHVPDMRPWANLMSNVDRGTTVAAEVRAEPDVSINEADLAEIARKKAEQRLTNDDA